MNRRLPCILILGGLLAACAGTTPYPDKKVATAVVAETAPAAYRSPCLDLAQGERQAFECDRLSILAMTGEFRVRFSFDETAALAAAYEPHAAQRSGGTEMVFVIADSGESISLQHVLVMKFKDEVHVVKHWRQDWHYQPNEILRYEGLGRYRRVALDADQVRGLWLQTVYEVDDAPRYAGLGPWTHADGVDAWTSEPSLRPLPRREYTKRSDYQAIEAINRHSLTPAGWVHEQDNTKLRIDASGSRQAIARERGINSYTRIDDFDFNPGREYWQQTRAFWWQVRSEWERGIAASEAFTLMPEPNGEPRIEKLFALAERAIQGESIPVAEIDAVMTEYGLPLPGARAAGERLDKDAGTIVPGQAGIR
jgi:hypothetical protein